MFDKNLDMPNKPAKRKIMQITPGWDDLEEMSNQ